MCGICGFMPATENDRPTLQAMCDIMAHRGPDGQGLYLDDGIALGHRRLSLIDLEGGGQPMVRSTGDPIARMTSPALRADGTPCMDEAKSAARGQWAIVFNGEIYNYRDIREQLEAQGWHFETNSDTEVLLVGYIAWGEDVLARLRGMFAFAIWNREAHELFCARDYFGIKPFYYTFIDGAAAGGANDAACNAQGAVADADDAAPRTQDATSMPSRRTFVFASEIKSILEHPGYCRAVNEEALVEYLCFQFNPLPETFFKGIYKLEQGHCMRVSADGSCETHRWWHPSYTFDEQRSEQETVEAIDAAMRESVRYHNVADVEVGSFLSSGIDSSYLAACLAQENPSIHTFTVGFDEYRGERDEISWARDLADKLQVSNESKHITEEEYWESLPRVQWHMDEPSADPSAVALFFVDQLAARHVKAVLSGEGADEFFGGYRIYQTPLANRKASWLPHSLLEAGSKVLRAGHLRGANYLERAAENVEDWYFTNANGVAFLPTDFDQLLSADMQAAAQHCPTPQQLTAPVYERVADLDDTTRMQYVDLQFWLVGDILLKTDKMSMAHSLESRVPFLDREVFELASSIPTRLKVNGHQTKLALRQAAERAIPHDWAQKEKLGFPVPLASWLRKEPYLQQIREAFNSPTARRYFNVDALARLLDEHVHEGHDRSRKIWIVSMFLMWHRVFFEG